MVKNEEQHAISEDQESNLQAALERERQRIARDIHDDVVQRIVHVLHKLELIQRLLERQQNQLAQDEVQQAYAQIEIGLERLRLLITSLLPPELEDHPFAEAI